MRALTRCLALWSLGVLLCTPAPAQFAGAPQDSLRKGSIRDSSGRHADSVKAVTISVDTMKTAGGAAQKGEVTKPRSSTVRTLERQTATHAAKNVPRVKNSKPTTR